ncbi:methyl-accepting chemotaxis protein [Oceanobacillus polygoni]|uniref:Methyl-accepting chemotaxis protein n=1 Tax=Oceanobacillus polygoni TaxID=1235259 RepID=A0A9X0Z073_9BACI|nr:methyl-accepting chemotaxis protein [Oceanobacillus polygoni]MBP2079321.1 methyl-accepting chemotaxis protein [Oceanobacillus polygoni]
MQMKKSKQAKKQKSAHNVGKKRRFRFHNIQIGKKYLYAFIATILLFVCSSLLVYFQLEQGQQDVEAANEYISHVNTLTELSSVIQAKDVQIADYLLTKNAVYIEAFDNYQGQFNSIIEQIEPMMVTDEQQSMYQELILSDAAINSTFTDKIVTYLENDQATLANTLRETTYRFRTSNVEIVDGLIQMMKAEQMEATENAIGSMDSVTAILLIANITTIIVGIIIFTFISRNVTSNLKQIVNITSEVANGNLTVAKLNYSGNDEIGQLASSVNQMKENMQNVLHNVTTASNAVSSRSEELTQAANEVKEGNTQIAVTMEELSSGAETQANGASDLAENMNEFVKTVIQSEKSGQEIATASQGVLALTTDGTTLMNESVQQMQRIDTIVSESVDRVKNLDKQSKEISNLVSVIKEIADQTNLLSLNAAIEAARAGEHGKGFAVVADEVRKLSDQVASSVVEITSIVTAIQSDTKHVVDSLSSGYKEVQTGSNHMEETRQSFDTIKEAVTAMTTKITSISANLKDIAGNSNAMNNLIEEIASVSEESAAGVEQAAASSQQTASSMEEVSHSADELASLAEQLNEQLTSFKL